MKTSKTLLIILIALTIFFISGVAIYSSMATLEIMDLVIYSSIFIIVAYSIYIFYKRYRDEKRGLTAEDELSKRIKERAGAYSFGASFYLWTLILLATLDSKISNEVIIGIGIAGMGILFSGFWIYLNNKGIDIGNSN